jgi:hypothetical protein
MRSVDEPVTSAAELANRQAPDAGFRAEHGSRQGVVAGFEVLT